MKQKNYYILGWCYFAHWAERDYGLSAGQHAVLPEGKGKGWCYSQSALILFSGIFASFSEMNYGLLHHPVRSPIFGSENFFMQDLDDWLNRFTDADVLSHTLFILSVNTQSLVTMKDLWLQDIPAH